MNPMGKADDAHEKDLLVRLAKAVKKRREERGWTQHTLATKSRTSRDIIKRLEAGTHDPRASVVFRVLPVLGFKLRDLQAIWLDRAKAA